MTQTYPDFRLQRDLRRLVNETNPIEESRHHSPWLEGTDAITVGWTDRDLSRITRLRLLTDPGFPFYDVSYCWGVLHGGTKVEVRLPFDQLPRKNMRGAIIEAAKRDRVYASGLGVFDALSILW